MTPKFQVGDTVIYNDGRPGHVDVRGKVIGLGRLSGRIIVQFEDRADTTVIHTDDPAWMNHLTKENQ